MKRPRTIAGAKRGLTLLEMMIALSILALVVTASMEMISAGTSSSAQVGAGVRENSEMRDGTRRLREELRGAGGGRFDVVPLADGNSELTFQVPVTSGGVAGWGVYDRFLGPGEDEWNRVDWSLRYTVLPDGDGGRQLVRQVLDDLDQVQRQTVLVTDLRAGNVEPPGFRVADVGDVWEVIVTTESRSAIGGESGGTRIHVRTQN